MLIGSGLMAPLQNDPRTNNKDNTKYAKQQALTDM